MLVVKMQFGSHLYGLDTPESDTDYKGIFLPEYRKLVLSSFAKSFRQTTGNSHSRNTSEDMDTELYSLHYFVKLALQGETVAIDMLHAQDRHIVETGLAFPVFLMMQKNRQKLYSKNMKAYLGYVRKQAAKYGVKGGRLASAEAVLQVLDSESAVPISGLSLPEDEHSSWIIDVDKQGTERRFFSVCGRKIEHTIPSDQAYNVVKKIVDNYGERARKARDNEGIDHKALSHALRAGYQLRCIYQDGDFEYPLPENSILLNVKQGKMDFVAEIQPMLEELVAECERLAQESPLPERPDRKYWEDLVVSTMERHVVKPMVRQDP